MARRHRLGYDLLLVRLDDLTAPLRDQYAAYVVRHNLQRSYVPLAAYRREVEIVTFAAGVHLLDARLVEQMLVILRLRRRQVGQEVVEADPLRTLVHKLESVLLAYLRERLGRTLRRGRIPHLLHQSLALAVRGVETQDTSLDQRAVEYEIGLMRIVVVGDILIREVGAHLLLDIVLVHLAHQKRMAVLLNHTVDILLRPREEIVGLLDLELAHQPLVNIQLYERHAVVTLDIGRHGLHDLVYLELLAANLGDGVVAHQIVRQIAARRHRDGRRSEQYFHYKAHNNRQRYIFTPK